MITKNEARRHKIPEERRNEINSWDDLPRHNEHSSGCLETIVFAIIILILYIWLASCNTAQHMQKVYPKGYYTKGIYHANHTKPRGSAEVAQKP